jgi:hypothetical protein
MDADQQIFSLLAAAEDQQKAVKAAIDGLAAERAALAKERAALTQAAASVAGVAGDVRKAAADAIPAMQKAAGEAVGASVRQSLVGASEAAAKALGEAAKPVIGSLSGVVQAANEVEGSMRNAGAWFAWKWVAVAAGGLVGVCLVAYASLAWQLHQVKSLGDEKAELAADVAQLQANVSALEKKGGRIVMTTCGGRLCIEASSNQGQGSEQWKGGSWSNKETGVQLVIPRGY